MIRGMQVMLDSDLAEIYGYDVKRLNEQVKRNINRFPEDFMFRLSDDEASILRSQNATANLSSKSRTNPIRLYRTGYLYAGYCFKRRTGNSAEYLHYACFQGDEALY